MIDVKIIRDSMSDAGHRLTTFELEYPRFIHAQVMTHRVFSRNAQSSRAMPVRKMLEDVRENPVVPGAWPKNQPGMSADDTLDDAVSGLASAVWMRAVRQACDNAETLMALGVHKQIANRLLEPFARIRTIITATDWENYFELRCNDAQPEHMILARKMKKALADSEPASLGLLRSENQWHLPYITTQELHDFRIAMTRKISVARCARVSYLNHNGKHDYTADLRLYEDLRQSGHWSPFEHVATPLGWADSPATGNFVGFAQLRHLAHYQ